MADHNWIPLALSNELMRLGQELTGDPDTERWIQRVGEFGMDWKPREERSYLGTYSMGSWKNPSLGRAFWGATAAGAACAAGLSVALAVGPSPGMMALGIISTIPLLGGAALGAALRERQRRQHTQRMLHLQSEEILFSNNELEKKFRDLETKIDQLSLLGDLAAAVSATLDPERIYEQALQRLVQNMGYQDVSPTCSRRRCS